MRAARGKIVGLLASAGLSITSAQAQVAPTPTPTPGTTPTSAGTTLTNTATVIVGVGPAAVAIQSNTARLIVAERLDLALATATATLAVPKGNSAIRFTLTNAGNGVEAMIVSGQIAGADAAINGYAVDRNDDGVFDPAIDLALAPNGETPPLAAGASVHLLVLLQANTVGSSGTLTLNAVAKTGSGTPGTVFAGMGDGGGDALVGPTTAAAHLTFGLSVVDASGPTAPSTISLVKSQKISGPNGGAAVSGATITYAMVATFGATGASPAARVVDPIPDGTVYVPGSLILDGAVLTDAADADAGAFTGSGIAVALGDVVAPASHTVQFEVTIK